VTAQEEVRSHPGGWLLLLPAIALIAILAFGLIQNGAACSIYVADGTTGDLKVEKRRIDLSGQLEEKASKLIAEFLLGPMEHDNAPLFQGEVRLGSVLHRSGLLHVDIELSDPPRQLSSLASIRKGMERSLSASLPGSGRLVLYVGGTQARER